MELIDLETKTDQLSQEEDPNSNDQQEPVVNAMQNLRKWRRLVNLNFFLFLWTFGPILLGFSIFSLAFSQSRDMSPICLLLIVLSTLADWLVDLLLPWCK